MAQAPVAIPAASALAVASLAVQGFADVDTLGGPRPVSLYVLTVARSGERKSSCDAPLMAALHAHEKEQASTQREAHALIIPGNVSLVVLPPYSPELNPVENVWQCLRANWLAISVFDDYDATVDACCAAWNRFAENPEAVSSITSRQWAQVNP
jgi:hypothetical protein